MAKHSLAQYITNGDFLQGVRRITCLQYTWIEPTEEPGKGLLEQGAGLVNRRGKQAS